MTMRALPADVLRFLQTHIHSALQLDALLLLRRTPERWWTVETLNRELRASLGATAKYVQEFRDAELLALHDAAFRFAPTEEDEAVVGLTANLFETHPHLVLDAIYAPHHGARAPAEPLKRKGEDEKD